MPRILLVHVLPRLEVTNEVLLSILDQSSFSFLSQPHNNYSKEKGRSQTKSDKMCKIVRKMTPAEKTATPTSALLMASLYSLFFM